MSPLAAACSAFSFCCSSLCLELISPWRCGWYLPSMPLQPLRSGGGSLRAEKPWLLASTLPTLVAAVAVMEDICQGGIAGFALHDDRSVGASLQSLHGWVGRPLEDRPGTKEKALASTEPHERRDASWSQGCRLGLSARICYTP